MTAIDHAYTRLCTLSDAYDGYIKTFKAVIKPAILAESTIKKDLEAYDLEGIMESYFCNCAKRDEIRKKVMAIFMDLLRENTATIFSDYRKKATETPLWSTEIVNNGEDIFSSDSTEILGQKLRRQTKSMGIEKYRFIFFNTITQTWSVVTGEKKDASIVFTPNMMNESSPQFLSVP
jgi:hypothetical protein